MNVFIVFAHPEPKSFCAELKDTAVATLTGAGHEVRVSDLYAMGFNPVAGPYDFKKRLDPDYLRVFYEQEHASEHDAHVSDVLAEQAKLTWADFVIFHSPVWWFSVPAILKGWFDRVLAVGFAYDMQHWYDTGKMAGKRAMLALTTGGPATIYLPRGLNGDINAILWPIHHGTLHFTGFTVLAPFIAYATQFIPREGLAGYRDAYRERLLNLDASPIVPRNPLSDYDDKYELKDGVEMIRPF